jgi:D-lactate dehydrogenase
MRVAVFSARRYDKRALTEANAGVHALEFFDSRLDARTAGLARGFDAVCAFVNDTLDRPALQVLASVGVRHVALRSAGFNHLDREALDDLGLTASRVPAYSPHAVAEHAVGMILSLNRRFHRAFNRVREGNFALDGLLGFDLSGKTVGVIGTGAIGAVFSRIMAGFGCRVLAADPNPNPDITGVVEMVDIETLLTEADIISLHCPLTPATYHIVDESALARMRDGVMLINTSRGALVDTAATIDALKSGKLGYLGLDVYEEEGDLFFEDLSDRVIQDDVFSRLLTFPNVLVTGHQGFFTEEAVANIAATTIENLSAVERGGRPAWVPGTAPAREDG